MTLDDYPFGLTHNYGASSPLSVVSGRQHKYGFGGKEYNEELGLDWYDVSARNYDPALGRWMNLDPLAEDMRRHSPYNFGFDNPIYFQDYDGMSPSSPDWIDNGDGTYTAEAGDSAWSLHTQHGVDAKVANDAIESQLGENYIGDDGGLKSDVEVDDVVSISSDTSDVAETEQAQPSVTIISKDNFTIHNDPDSSKFVGDLVDKKDSLSKEITKSHKRMEVYNSMNDFARKYEKMDPGSGGVNLGNSLGAARNESDSVNNVNRRDRVNKQIDSVLQSLIHTQPKKGNISSKQQKLKL